MGADGIAVEEMAGWLRKPGKLVKVRRFYRLKGTTLSSHKSEADSASWSVDIADSIVTGVGQLDIIVEVPDQKVLQLHAEDPISCDNWMRCLQQAASRKIESFYTVGRELGTGPFSKSVLSTHKKSCKQYAIKSIEKRLHLVNYAETELKAMRMVDHPNLVKTIDFFDTKNKVHIVSEYLKGGLLYDSVAKQEFVTEQTASLVMRELLKTVACLHKDGFCHRNIKPSNLICANSMFPQSVRLSDFGIAAFLEKACENEDYFETSTRTIVTAPHFTAPEILHGRDGITQAVDVYSCGVVLYTLLSGTLPFTGKTKQEVSNAVKQADGFIDFPDAQWRNVSEDAKELCRMMLAAAPADRISSAQALSHSWVTSDDKDNRVILANLKNLPDIPSLVWDHAKPSYLYSLDSTASHASEGTFVISSETHKKMASTRTKMMYKGGGGKPGTQTTTSGNESQESETTMGRRKNGLNRSSSSSLHGSADQQQDKKRSSRGLGRSSRGMAMSRMSKGLKKNSTFALFGGRGDKKDGPSEYW